MKIPDEIMKMIDKAMHEMMHDHDDHDDSEGYIQVGKLEGEVLTKTKTAHADQDKLSQSQKLLISKLEALEAKKKVLHTQMWDAIYKALSISPSASYKITSDYRVLREIEKKDD